MKAFVAIKSWWNTAAIPTRIVAGMVTALMLVGVFSLTANGMSPQGETLVTATVPPPTTSSTPRVSSTPSTTAQPNSTAAPSPEETSPQQVPLPVVAPVTPAAPIAPAFEAFSATATQYGIGILMDNGPSTFPTGRIFAAEALPVAQGTGPLTYSVSGLPVGAGFDAGQRKIFIDTETFIPANQQDYTFNVCYIRQRVNFASTVQYTVTGPGGQATAAVPLQFGIVALGAGILHQGC